MDYPSMTTGQRHSGHTSGIVRTVEGSRPSLGYHLYTKQHRINEWGWKNFVYERVWRYGERLVERYTIGQCWHFARALHRLTGWQIVVVSPLEHEEITKEDSLYHALVRNADGGYLDFRGLVNIHSVLDQYGVDYIREVKASLFGTLPQHCCRYSEQFARRWILRHRDMYLHGVDADATKKRRGDEAPHVGGCREVVSGGTCTGTASVGGVVYG